MAKVMEDVTRDGDSPLILLWVTAGATTQSAVQLDLLGSHHHQLRAPGSGYGFLKTDLSTFQRWGMTILLSMNGGIE